MSMLPLPAVLMAGWLCLALACSDTHAESTAMVFEFPHERGSLQLRDERCADTNILRLYEGDVPKPFLAGTLDLSGRILGGCWYRAEDHVFFTDSEGDLLLPLPPVGAFSPATNLLRTSHAINRAAPPSAGLP
jgi:hypothetical protein